MASEEHWEHVQSIDTTDEKGNSYEIDEQQVVITSRALNGHVSTVRGRTRWLYNGEPVSKLPNNQYQLVQRKITVTAKKAAD